MAGSLDERGTMAEDEIERELTEFIAQEVLAEGDDYVLRPEQALLMGAIDSFGLMTIITFLEETYDITVDVRDVTTENFRSVRAMADFVRSQASNAAGA